MDRAVLQMWYEEYTEGAKNIASLEHILKLFEEIVLYCTYEDLIVPQQHYGCYQLEKNLTFYFPWGHHLQIVSGISQYQKMYISDIKVEPLHLGRFSI